MIIIIIFKRGFIMIMIIIITSDKEGGKCVCPRSFVCLFVCLSVSNITDYSKRRARILMKCCVSTDVGTWTN